ncbi:MAG: amidohydrolase family protein [Acidobacteriota bacterium]|nr:amidohydrolase family protein [Acidobacteriota bacterium]
MQRSSSRSSIWDRLAWLRARPTLSFAVLSACWVAILYWRALGAPFVYDAALKDLAMIEDGSVLIRDGLIAQVGSSRRIENLKEVRGANEIDVHGAIVMPGFVDAAIQLSPALSLDSVKRNRVGEFHDESLTLMRACLQHGTLNAQVKANGQDGGIRSGFSLLRQLAQIGDSPVGMIRTWQIADRSGPYSKPSIDFEEAIALIAKRKLAQKIEVCPESSGAVREKVWAAALAHRVAVNLLWPGGAAETLANLLARAQAHSVSCSHGLSAAECAVLAESPVPVVLSPVRSLQENTSSDIVRQLAETGGPIALSSGYDNREMPVFNMQAAIALAVLRLKLTAEQAICAATINAAHALGMGHNIGSLEPGKRADLLVMNLPDYREIPRRFGSNHVGMVIRDGKIAFNRTGWKVSAV